MEFYKQEHWQREATPIWWSQPNQGGGLSPRVFSRDKMEHFFLIKNYYFLINKQTNKKKLE